VGLGDQEWVEPKPDPQILMEKNKLGVGAEKVGVEKQAFSLLI
jgi:hypothetical protein